MEGCEEATASLYHAHNTSEIQGDECLIIEPVHRANGVPHNTDTVWSWNLSHLHIGYHLQADVRYRKKMVLQPTSILYQLLSSRMPLTYHRCFCIQTVCILIYRYYKTQHIIKKKKKKRRTIDTYRPRRQLQNPWHVQKRLLKLTAVETLHHFHGGNW